MSELQTLALNKQRIRKGLFPSVYKAVLKLQKASSRLGFRKQPLLSVTGHTKRINGTV